MGVDDGADRIRSAGPDGPGEPTGGRSRHSRSTPPVIPRRTLRSTPRPILRSTPRPIPAVPGVFPGLRRNTLRRIPRHTPGTRRSRPRATASRSRVSSRDSSGSGSSAWRCPSRASSGPGPGAAAGAVSPSRASCCRSRGPPCSGSRWRRCWRGRPNPRVCPSPSSRHPRRRPPRRRRSRRRRSRRQTGRPALCARRRRGRRLPIRRPRPCPRARSTSTICAPGTA